MTLTANSIDFFNRWLSVQETNVGRHVLLICAENHCSWDDVIDELRDVVRSHYVAPETTAKRLADLGAPRTAELLREHLPTSKRARSGDLGEVLATEFTERRLSFSVPVRRLRWKDGRDMALRGDDIVAIARDPNGRLMFLKGESKSRAELTSAVVTQAADALDRDAGRPTRHSVLFVADRLREQGEDIVAREIEEAVLQSFDGSDVEHLLFVLSGNSADTYLSDHISACTDRHRRHAVGVRIEAYGEFIERMFSEL